MEKDGGRLNVVIVFLHNPAEVKNLQAVAYFLDPQHEEEPVSELWHHIWGQLIVDENVRILLAGFFIEPRVM